MARPRAATDEQIIEAAEAIAAEKGWRNVYAKAVHERMDVGGSLSTFTKVINSWRAEKASTDTDEQKLEGEIVEDRVSVIDEGLQSVASMLKSMRDAVTAEIDRAVADERKKSDRVRADERELHEKKIAGMNAVIDEITSENDGLATEAQAEADRADTAENSFTEAQREISHMIDRLRDTEAEAAKIPALRSQIEDLISEKEKIEADSEAAITNMKSASEALVKKAEERERIALHDKKAIEEKLDRVTVELKAASADLATARADLATARAERSQADDRVKTAEKQINDLKAEIERERSRADDAWSRVDALTAEMKEKTLRHQA